MHPIPRRTVLMLPAAAMLGAAGCADTNLGEERARRAAKAKGDIVIGVPWPYGSPKGTYWSGVEMAWDEVNGAGGVLGRKLSLIKRDDKLSVTLGTNIAYEFCNDLDMVAVLGTLNSYIAVATAPVYENAGLLFMTPGASVSRLTTQGYKYVFRMIPGNRHVGELLADHARAKGYKRVLIYYVKNEYGLDLANAFEQRAYANGLEVGDRASYMAAAGDYRLAMQHWRDFYRFDAIFLAASLPEGAEIIQAIREVGIKQPVFGADGLDANDLIRLGGAAVEGTETTAFFHPSTPLDHVQKFKAAFEKRYQRLPDTPAAVGYDAVHLMADAIKRAGSTVPAKIGDALRKGTGWRGVTGMHRFDDKGDVRDKDVVIQVVRNGRFEYQAISGAKAA